MGKLEGEKKLLYDSEYMEQLYLRYQDQYIDDHADLAALRELFAGKTLLVTGPGTTMHSEWDRIESFLCEHRPLTVTINYAPSRLRPDCIFLTNAKRYIQVATALSQQKIPVIATSNVTPTNEPFSYQVNISSLLDRSSEYADNSLMMLLKILMRSGVKEVYLAGFDGYSGTDANYFDNGKEYVFAKQKADYLNRYMSDFIRENRENIRVHFLTSTKYEV